MTLGSKIQFVQTKTAKYARGSIHLRARYRVSGMGGKGGGGMQSGHEDQQTVGGAVRVHAGGEFGRGLGGWGGG